MTKNLTVGTSIGAALLLAATVLLPIGATAASAAEDPVQDRVDSVIADFGGVQTGAGEITWNGGEAVLEIIPAAEVAGVAEDARSFASDALAASSLLARAAVGNCASGKICAYSGSSMTLSKLSFSTCSGANSVAALGAVRSIANARSSGSAYGYNGATKVVTVSADSYKNTTAKITRVGC
jgi:hypothetical protein